MNRYTRSETEEICSWYLNGKTLEEIASKLGTSTMVPIRVLNANNIPRRDSRACHRVYRLNENSFDELTPEACYWIGFIVADGNLYTRRGHEFVIQIALAVQDKSHLTKLQKFLNSNRPLQYEEKKEGNSYRLTINSKVIYNKLEQYGLTPCKSLTASITSNHLLNSKDFWRGVIDGDGSLIPHHKYYTLNLVGSKFLLQQYCNFLSKQLKIEVKIKPHKNIYSVDVSGKNARATMFYLYKDADIYLDRKYQTVLDKFNKNGDKF